MELLIEVNQDFIGFNSLSIFHGNIGGQTWETINQAMKKTLHIFPIKNIHSGGNSKSSPKRSPEIIKKGLKSKAINSAWQQGPTNFSQNQQENRKVYFREDSEERKKKSTDDTSKIDSEHKLFRKNERNLFKGVQLKRIQRSKTEGKGHEQQYNFQQQNQTELKICRQWVDRAKNKGVKALTFAAYLSSHKKHRRNNSDKLFNRETSDLKILAKQELRLTKKIHSKQKKFPNRRPSPINIFQTTKNQPPTNKMALAIISLKPKNKKLALRL